MKAQRNTIGFGSGFGAAARQGLVAAALVFCGCAPEKEAAGGPSGASAPEGDATLVNLQGHFGTEGKDELWAEAIYKKKRKGGKELRQLELEVEDAPPGVAHALVLDGVALGQVKTDAKGDVEFAIAEEDGQRFPEGFREPAPGAVLKVGELMELSLEAPEVLTDLQVPISGANALAGKVSFRVERLAGNELREFHVKVEKAPAQTTHAVTLDGVEVGKLMVDASGAGKIKFSSKDTPGFPASFPALHADSKVQIGELFSGALKDARAK